MYGDIMSLKSFGHKDRKSFNKVIDVISGIFIPVLNVLMAAALIKGFLVFLVNMKLLTETDGVYQILYAASDGFFYFLPLFLAYTASIKLKADTFTSVMIAAALVYPNITEAFNSGQHIEFLGMQVKAVNYPSSVIPVILAIGLLHFIELPLEKYLPTVLKGFLKPMICILIVVPATFLIFGPFGTMISDILAAAFSAVYGLSPVIAGVILGFLWQPIVVFGLQWGVVPVIINNITTTGIDHILPILGPGVMGQAGAALAVSFITKNAKRKALAMSSSVTAILGVTEPALYGITIPLKRPMIAACIAGAIGGGLVGTSNAGAVSFAFPSVISLIVYLGDGFLTYVIALVAAFIIGFLLTYIFGIVEDDTDLQAD
jgi:PTS system beta-glucosides-specific IIC component